MIFNKYKLGDLGIVYSGGTPSTKNKEYWDGNISWITPKDLSGYNYKYISFGERYITEQGLNKSSAVLIPKGAVLMSSRAPIGYVAINEKELTTNQGFKSIKCNEKICLNEYMYYWIKNNVEYIKSKASGSTFKEISGSNFKDLSVSVPSIENQKKIVQLLSIIDKKIDLNNEMNNNLYGLCRNYFEHIFNYDMTLDSLENLCFEITRGYTKNYVEKSNLINLNQKVNKGIVLEKKYYKYLDENQEIPQNRYVKKNDVLLNSLGQGTLGRVHLFGEDVNNVVIDQHISILRTGNKISPYYLYFLLSSDIYQNKLENSVTGTTGMLMLNISVVRNFKIPVPIKEDIDRFDKIAKICIEKVTANTLENESLTKLRDTLLPKLMNGEIDLDNIGI